MSTSHVDAPNGIDADAVTALCGELGIRWPVKIVWDPDLKVSGRHRHRKGEQLHRIALHPNARNKTLIHECGHALDCEAMIALGEDWFELTRNARDEREARACAIANQFASRQLITKDDG